MIYTYKDWTVLTCKEFSVGKTVRLFSTTWELGWLRVTKNYYRGRQAGSEG